MGGKHGSCPTGKGSGTPNGAAGDGWQMPSHTLAAE